MALLIRKATSTAVCFLFICEALFHLWTAYAMGLPFWEASALLPAFVVTDIAVGAGLAVCGIAFASGFSLADRVLTLCWPLFVLYGAWVFRNGHSIMSNWTGIFEGDLVTLGAISGIGYVLIGLVLFATRMLQAPR